ncbi:non-specific lipid transfer protein GPI-anchored 25 [Cornus florida]|uniref:non-specific lipid transfer protein GPI-anchored 25 n=1 Tax=Cornus florida TaxID=4283 RepID=UPI0028A20FB7|nr:non-specific lipid transfer protein GPI-anchored 25 [Cornus florida]
MAPNNLTLFFPAMIALLLTPPLLAVASTAPPPAKGCSDEIVSFSPCLPYVSSSPNNSSSSPSIQCCDVFSSAFDTGDADCLCYLSRRPLLLGFPVNSTRLFSLSSLCPPKNAESQTRGSLQSICSG